MTFPFSTRTVNLLVLCLFCLALTLLSGCGGGVPKLTPVEQAEVDKYVKDHGRDSLARYLMDISHRNVDEKLVIKYVKYFVSQGADVNSALGPAIYNGNFDIVKFLVSKGADIGDRSGFLLVGAVGSGNIEIVKLLVSKGAEVKDDNGSLLHSAIRSGNIEIVKFLVSKGAEVKDDNGSLLHSAIRSGNIEIVKFLVSKGADVNAKDSQGWTPLDWAKQYGQEEIVQYLSGLK